MTLNAPPTLQSLRARIRNYVGNAEAVTAERTIALIVLGQILLACEGSSASGGVAAAIKGGTAMRLRYGTTKSRFSRDFDVARAADLDTFLSAFTDAAARGWGGFIGSVQMSRSKAQPEGVPEDYVMVAFDVKLKYQGVGGVSKSFLTVPLEIGADELEDTAHPPRLIDPAVVTLFRAVGLPDPLPLPVISDDHQIAQKLHAVSAPGSERAHDLIDLQLLARATSVPDREIVSTCRRLFSFRKKQSWPPLVIEGEDWPSLYDAQSNGLGVLPDVAGAVHWVNGYIHRLDSAR
jgi:hypothetical protein